MSPFIAEGRISEGQEAARVPPFAGNVVSYAGFLTVNETYNSNLFFWYFPAEKANGTTPLALWLQGGPGATSLFGLFEEHGPYYIDKKGQARLRHYSWTRKLSMLYIDNPVGTGFSFTDDDRGYVTNQEQVSIKIMANVSVFGALKLPGYIHNILKTRELCPLHGLFAG